MSIQLKKINNEIVKPVKLDTDDNNKPIKGYDVIPELYANIFLNAKKKSGKSTVLFNLIKKCCDKKTHVVIFCSTLYKDATYKCIRDWLDKHNVQWEGYTSLVDEGTDKLEELVQRLQNEAPKEEEQKGKGKEKKQNIILCDSDLESDEEEEKTKFRTPEYLIILDDLSTELKSTSLVSLLKKNRHFKSKIIISSQYWNDLRPESRKQMDSILIFKSIPENKLKEIYHDADLAVSYETFIKLYRNATKDPYNFLYIDCNDNSFRRNFNYKYELKKDI
jgi:hypothetical protein